MAGDMSDGCRTRGKVMVYIDIRSGGIGTCPSTFRCQSLYNMSLISKFYRHSIARQAPITDQHEGAVVRRLCVGGEI